ncbi:MAG: 1-acyl-sn-glycerol-3-phosphate acyltransferase, partial [Comamonadaceae bacterium]
IWRTLCASPIEAVVHYGAPELAGERDRRVFTQDLQQAVDRLRRS